MFQLLLLFALFVAGHTQDIKQRLETPPPPVKGFSLQAYLGPWFVQYRKAPCSWSGSSAFTDYEQEMIPTGKGYLLHTLTWRSRGICNSVTGQFLINGPGVLNHIDTMGGSSSGRVTVAATDYKNFLIHWACTKMAASGDTCEDPWISIATRQRFPSPIVLNVIETVLRIRWGITTGELQKIPHTAPCQQTIPKKC